MKTKEKEGKRVLVTLDTKRQSLEYAKKLIDLLYPNNVVLAFYLGGGKFSLEEKVYGSINDFIFKEDVVVNLLPVVNSSISKEVEYKSGSLHKHLFESLDKRILFSSKNNIKNILRNGKIKTPVFQFLGNRSAEETYSTFTQPSRVFSKKNNFYSDKVDSVNKLREVFLNIPDERRGDYMIEEYIEGQDIYAFVFKYNDHIISYSVSVENTGDAIRYTEPSKVLKGEVKEVSERFFKNFGFSRFVLLHFKSQHERGLYFLNVFVDHKILDDEKYLIVSKIFSLQGISFNIFMKKMIF